MTYNIGSRGRHACACDPVGYTSEIRPQASLCIMLPHPPKVNATSVTKDGMWPQKFNATRIFAWTRFRLYMLAAAECIRVLWTIGAALQRANINNTMDVRWMISLAALLFQAIFCDGMSIVPVQLFFIQKYCCHSLLLSFSNPNIVSLLYQCGVSYCLYVNPNIWSVAVKIRRHCVHHSVGGLP